MTTSIWSNRVRGRTVSESDVLIIGGGFVGLSTAYWLKQFARDLRIKVVEKGLCGSGASGRNAGFITKGSASFYGALLRDWGPEKALAVYDYAKESIRLLGDHFLDTGDVQREAAASVTLVRGQEISLSEFGFHWLPLASISPDLRAPFIGGLVSPGEYKLHPVGLVQQIKKTVEDLGVEVIEESQVFDLLGPSVLSEDLALKATTVVIATNGYSAQLHPAFRPLIFPRRAQMLAVNLDRPLRCPDLYYDSPERVYWRMADQRTLLIGGKRLLDETEERGEYDKVTTVIQDGLEHYVKHELGLGYTILRRWSGLMGFTESELPLLTKISNRNMFLVAGFSGHGMGLGFRAAKETAELVLGRKPASLFNSFRDSNIVL